MITPNKASAVTPNHATPNLARTKKTPDSSKRKAETDSEPRKTLKNDVSTVSIGDLSNIQPLAIKPHDSATSLQDTPAPELGPGWRRIYHKTAKSSWNTYISPTGKLFKNLKSAKESMDQITKNHDAAPVEQSDVSFSDDVPTKLDVITVTNTVTSGWNRGSDNNLKNVQLVHGYSKPKPKPRKKATKPAQPLAEEIKDETVSMVEFEMEEETEEQYQEEESEDQEEEYQEEEIEDKDEQYQEEQIEDKEEQYQEEEIEEQEAEIKDDEQMSRIIGEETKLK